MIILLPSSKTYLLDGREGIKFFWSGEKRMLQFELWNPSISRLKLQKAEKQILGNTESLENYFEVLIQFLLEFRWFWNYNFYQEQTFRELLSNFALPELTNCLNAANPHILYLEKVNWAKATNYCKNTAQANSPILQHPSLERLIESQIDVKIAIEKDDIAPQDALSKCWYRASITPKKLRMLKLLSKQCSIYLRFEKTAIRLLKSFEFAAEKLVLHHTSVLRMSNMRLWDARCLQPRNVIWRQKKVKASDKVFTRFSLINTLPPKT